MKIELTITSRQAEAKLTGPEGIATWCMNKKKDGSWGGDKKVSEIIADIGKALGDSDGDDAEQLYEEIDDELGFAWTSLGDILSSWGFEHAD